MKCLITDDSKVTRASLRKIVEEFDIEVIEAEDGMTAIETLAAEVIDLCLVDWNMPRMNGTEMIRVMRTHPADRNSKLATQRSPKSPRVGPGAGQCARGHPRAAGSSPQVRF